MNDKLLYVFDTNVIVSAFLFFHSKPAQALFKALKNGQLVLSTVTADELSEVLSRKKFDRYIHLKKRTEFLKALLQEAVFAKITERIQICRDPEDDKFIELAVSAEAECIVSSDDDLLVLNPFRDIPILTPDEFLKR